MNYDFNNHQISYEDQHQHQHQHQHHQIQDEGQGNVRAGLPTCTGADRGTLRVTCSAKEPYLPVLVQYE